MPAALLDTNSVSDLMRDHPKVKARMGSHPDRVLTSVVVVGEIRYGLNRLPSGKKRRDLEARAQTILALLAIEPVTEPIADTYGRLKASLESQGLTPDDNDLWIAATALTSGHLLVSRDKIFSHVPGLQTEDWSV
jgi:predicted nucleic acid-binding protein